MKNAPASPTDPAGEDRFLAEMAATNLVRMTWLLLTSTTLSITFLAYNFVGPRDWGALPWQISDIGGSILFLAAFIAARRGHFPRSVRWLLSPAYFAFWLTLMMGYYFTALRIYGENMTFALGAVTPSVLILLPPRCFLSLLGIYYLVFSGIQVLLGVHGVRSTDEIFSSMSSGTLAIIVAMLAAWFGYAARRSTFAKEEQVARQAADLRRTESHLRAILENIPFQAWLKDLDGRYLAVNREFARANGRSQEEIIGLRSEDIYPPDRAGLYTREDRLLAQVGERIHEEQVVEYPDGTVWYEVFKSPVVDDTGLTVGTAGLARDVTDRKAMEAQVLAANRAKSEFLAAMSHEIRTPMNSVLGYAQLLHEQPLDRVQSAYVDSILTSGRILLVVINDILDLSRIEAGQLVLSPLSFPLRPLLDRSLRMFDPQAAEKGISLRLEIDPDLPLTMYADPTRLEQILVNLLSNAVKFTSRGAVTLRARAGRGIIILAVEDTGIGISPEQLEALFQPFSQVDATIARRFGGTGLGLVITRRLCQLMGGSVEVESRHGEGSIFTATLPLHPGDGGKAASGGATENTDEVADLSVLRVLIVEDNPSNRRLLSSILRRWQIVPQLAESGAAALELFETQRFDVVLMDVQMPGMDGLETTRCIRAWEKEHPEHRPARIIALTALAMAGDAERCLASGMNDYLTKPINVTLLERALRERGTPHDPA
jgi:PAS domain S-box-containing protein